MKALLILTPELIDQLDVYAKNNDLSKSQVVRMALRQFLAKVSENGEEKKIEEV